MAKRNVSVDPFGLSSLRKAYERKKDKLRQKQRKKKKDAPSVPRSKSGRVG